MVLSGLLAGVLRVNIPAAILGDVLLKSFFPLFFYFNLLVGDFLVGIRPHHIPQLLFKLLNVAHFDFAELRHFGKAFFLGAVVNTLVFGTMLCVIVYIVFSRYKVFLAKYVYRFKR